VNKSIGAHRLAIFAGSVATIAWLVVVIFLSNSVQNIGLDESSRSYSGPEQMCGELQPYFKS
jgi:hypothetical protein